MTDMTVVVLGHGGGIPNAKASGNTNFALVMGKRVTYLESGYDLMRKYPYLLIDCGPATLQTICERNLAGNLLGVVLTHCHHDHSGGLPSLAWRMKFVEKKTPLLIFHPALHGILGSQLIELRYMTSGKVAWGSYWEIPELESALMGGHTISKHVSLGDVGVTLFPVDHNIPDWPSFGVQISLPGGRKIVFSGDTACPLLDFSADLIYHDVQFYSEDETAVHCPYKELLAAVPDENVRARVYLAHHDISVGYPDGTLMETSDGFRWARQGDLFEIPSAHTVKKAWGLYREYRSQIGKGNVRVEWEDDGYVLLTLSREGKEVEIYVKGNDVEICSSFDGDFRDWLR